MKKFLSTQAAAAVALVFLGTTGMMGWILRDAAMIQIRHGFVGMVFNAALCFALVGIALCLPMLKFPWKVKAQTMIGWGLIALASAILVEYIANINLFFDFSSFHSWLNDGNPRPGRMAPGSSLGFLLCGAVLVMMPRVRSKSTGVAIQLATFIVLMLGLVALSSYFLRLDLLYPWFPSARMALQTAAGMTVAGVGLWSAWRHAEWYQTQRYFRDDEKTGYVGATILSVIALTAGVVGFSVQQATLERAFSQSLLAQVKNQTMLFQTAVKQRAAAAESAAHRPHLVQLIGRLSSHPQDSGAASELRLVAQSILASDVSSIAIYDKSDREIVRLGRFAGKPEIETALGLASPASVFWDGALYLRSRSTVQDKGEAIGWIAMEQVLSVITEQFARADGPGVTGEMGMCVRQLEHLLCFPQHHNSNVHTSSRLGANGELTAMGHAVDGQSGFFRGPDYRGHNVIAAYGPLTATGLGIAIKQDAAELFQPIREQLQWYGPLLILLVASGAMLLRSQVTPMVSKLLLSESAAMERELHIHTIVDNVGEGIITLNEHGVIESFNLAASRIFGHSADEAIGQNVKILMPPQTDSLHEAGMHRYLQGGKAHIVGKGGTELPGRHKDGTVFPLELTINEMHIGGRQLFVGIVRDITHRKQAERALQESEARSREITETLGEGVIVTDRQGTILFSNPAAQRLLGWTERELFGQHGHSLFHHTRSDGTHHPAASCEIGKVVFSGRNFRAHDETYWRKDGSMLPVSVNATPIVRNGLVVGMVGAFHDIIERKKAEQALATESAKNAMLLRTASDGIHVLDMDGNVVQANDAFCRMLGYTPEELQGMNVTQWDVQWSAEEMKERLRQPLDHDVLFETRHRRRDGSIFDVEIHVGVVVIGGERLLYASARDISERKKAAEQVDHLAHFDILTDLPNRALLTDRLQQALVNTRRNEGHIALMFIDLDKFKPVNDTLGHHIGDLLLKDVAKRLQDCLRESDTVARVGGDEFVVLLPRISVEQDATVVAEKILQTVSRPFMLEEHVVHISASIGVATYPEHGADQEQLMKSADRAMYFAKESGGASIVSFGQLAAASS